MRVIEKIAESNRDNLHNKPVTIAFLGDSVTQGYFRSTTDYDAVYHNKLRQKLQFLYPDAKLQIVNAGINGTSAAQALPRLDRDVLSYHPDMCVVCFGLNDVGKLEEGLPVYEDALRNIFQRLQERNCEVIFMTPNMINTRVVDYTPEKYKEYATNSIHWQADGIMDRYMEAAVSTAKQCGVTVCDCYKKWKKLEKCGVDTTLLLSNGINHPKKKMHELFANSLLETMFD